MATTRLAVSTLFLVKKEFDYVEKALREHPVYRNWEIIDEGFHRLDSQRVKALKDVGSTGGLTYSVHAPFSSINIAEPHPRLSGTYSSILEDALRNAYILEAENLILHPGRLTPFTYFFPEEGLNALIGVLNHLVEASHDLGVQLVLENMMGPYDLFTDLAGGVAIAEKVDGLGFCIDTGHANIVRSLWGLLNRLPRVRYLHIHDNDGVVDSHLPVGEGSVDWRMVKESLGRRGFNGWITAENYELSQAYESLSYFKDP